MPKNTLIAQDSSFESKPSLFFTHQANNAQKGEKDDATSSITLVTSPNCSYCHAAKSLLQQRNLPYREIDLLQDSELAGQLLAQSGRRTVPQIFINQSPIGGYTELAELLSRNEFDSTQFQTL